MFTIIIAIINIIITIITIIITIITIIINIYIYIYAAGDPGGQGPAQDGAARAHRQDAGYA